MNAAIALRACKPDGMQCTANSPRSVGFGSVVRDRWVRCVIPRLSTAQLGDAGTRVNCRAPSEDLRIFPFLANLNFPELKRKAVCVLNWFTMALWAD